MRVTTTDGASPGFVHDDAHPHPHGWRCWLYATKHKDIGPPYLWFAVSMFMVWAHHMLATGMPVTAQLFFMYATMLVAVPTGVKVFNWIATVRRGSITFETAMLFAIGFIWVFTIGGFSGLLLAVAPIDIQVHDTYYVVAHFDCVLAAGQPPLVK